MNCSCGHPLWAPASIERGHCEACERLPAEYRAGLRPFPYRLPDGYKLDPRGSGDEPEMYGPAPRRPPPDAEAFYRSQRAQCPQCSACGKAMTCGQRGTHLSCAPGYIPWTKGNTP